jgi:UDP-N-acetylmuramate: L-alanyl-gamma-D-glutamyl-meso-diaminopimelate ligase
LRDLFLDRSRNAVVAGGLGKTTTTSMLAWILESARRDPDYLIGGLARNFAAPARLRGAEFAVIEGDEYASCFDDPQPKFMHYRPEVAIITNIVEDHPDFYPDIRSVEDAFGKLVRSIPRTGRLVIPDDDQPAMRLAAACDCSSVSTGFSSHADERITNLEPSAKDSKFRLGGTEFVLPLCGRMNVRNAAMAVVAAAHFGVSYRQSAEALARFAGVHNRQDSRALGEYILVVDKASHPISLRALFEATRQEHPRRNIVSVIQPRATGGRDWVYQQELPAVLADADRVVLLNSYEHNPEPGHVWNGGQFSTEVLLTGLTARGVPVALASDRSALADALRRSANPGDVIVVSLPEQATDSLATIEMTLMEAGMPREPGSLSAGRSPPGT